MAVVNITGGHDFTVSGVTVTPTAGATYTNNGVTFTVKSTTISGGSGKIMTSGAGVPAASGTLTKVSGTGDATIAFSVSYNAQHLGDTTYVAGDTLSIVNTSNVFTRLLIDAQNAADVTKVEGTLIGILSMSNINGEILFQNTSTTTPLIVKINGEQNHVVNGNKSVFKTRGAWISIGTGTGLDNQTISVASVGGKLIDWPPYVEVETSAGSGVYVKMLNIGGNYLDGYTGSGLTPTAYPVKDTFAECGKTIDNGHFFEFDEQNSTIHFGSAAVGGWVPPNGSNIRINNIHFTGTARPNASATSRNRITSVAGVFDMENTSFSNRWGVGAAQFWPLNLRIRNVGFLTGSSPSNVNGTVDIDHMACPLDLYTSARAPVSFSFCNGPFSLSNYWGCFKTTSNGFLSSISNIVNIGEIRMTLFAKSSAFQYCFTVNNCIAGGGDDAPVTMGPFYANGGNMNFQNSMNLRLYGYYFSDVTTGVASATNTQAWITFFQGNTNCTIEKMRILNGGCPSNASVLSGFVNPNKNISIHDVVIDGKNPQTLAVWQKGFANDMVERKWMTNFTLSNFVTASNAGSLETGTGAPFTYPIRFCDITNSYQTMNACSGMFIEGVSTDISPGAGLYDVSPAHLLRTSGKTVGTLYLYPSVVNQKANQVSVSGGTDGVDYYMTSGLALPGAGVTITYTPTYRIRAVTGVSSAVMAINGTTPTSGTTFNFRIRPYGQTTWPAYTAISTVADFKTAFNAMSGYNSSVGFELQWQIISSTNVPARTITSIQFTGLNLDGSWTAPEAGYIQVGYVGSTPGSTVGVLDYTTPSSPVLISYTTTDSTGAYTFDYPYAFDGTAVNFKVVSRLSGYSEGTSVAQSHQAGKIVPVSQTLQYSITDADIDAANLAINGSAKTFTVSASHTMLELYQRAQWWSHQSSNLIYDIPMTTTSGTNFVQSTGWNLLGPSYLTGGGTITGGTVTLDGPNTYSTSFSGATVVAQGEGTYTFNATSSIITFAPTTNAVTYSLGGGTFSGTLDLRNTHASRTITVQLPAGTSYTTANNTGAAITVSSPTISQGLAFTGLVAGSQVIVFTSGTQTALYTDASSGSTSTFSQVRSGVITVDYTVMKAGYLPIRVTGISLDAAVLTTPISQVVDKDYTASSGLTYGVNATINTSTKIVSINTATTPANHYAFMIESWISQSALLNTAFPCTTDGPNSVAYGLGYEWRGWASSQTQGTGIANTSLNLLSGTGMSYVNTSGVTTAIWAAISSSGVPTGKQVNYQQTDGGTTVAANNTGNINQLIQTYGDASYGNFDYRNWLVLKVQADGYYQAEVNLLNTYSSVKDQLYPIALTPTLTGLATGSPTVNGTPTISSGTYTVGGKTFSLKIVDGAGENTGTILDRWLRYNYSLGGTFQSKAAFNWPDIIQTNGTKFKTTNGVVYGPATTKGAVVYKSDGVTLHPDFNLFTADDGTTYSPPVYVYQSVSISGLTANSRVQIYDQTSSTELYNGIVAGTSYTWTDSLAASASRSIRLRVAYVTSSTANNFIDTTIGTCGITTTDSAISYLVSPVVNSIYIDNAIDGTIITDCSITGTNLRVDISTGTTSWQHIYAFMTYWLYTSGGIRDQYLEMTATDQTHYIFATAHGSFKIKNVGAGPLVITGGNAAPDSGAVTDILDTTGGTIFCIENTVVPFTYSTGSGLSTAEHNKLFSIPDDVWASTDGTTVKNNAKLIPAAL